MEDLQKEFIPYDRALKLKELGFDETCFGYRDGLGNLMIKHTPHCVISAPTFSQAFRWFREKHNLWAYQIPWSGNMYCMQIWRLIEDSETVKTIQDRVIMNTWEEAELACLDKLLEIVEQKQKEDGK